MIKVEQLSKSFGKIKAVDGISFEVAEGKNLILLGTSGCGKTTTLKMINRLIEPTSGDIFINGQNILEQSPEALRRGIGYVLQNNGLFPHYTVAENIAVVPQLL
jgi:osmoprotectant transport system ATP-binding protein